MAYLFAYQYVSTKYSETQVLLWAVGSGQNLGDFFRALLINSLKIFYFTNTH